MLGMLRFTAKRVSLITLLIVSTSASAQDDRTAAPLASGWRFYDGDAPGASAASFSDGTWQSVSVPHTWNRVGYYHHDLGGTNTQANVRTRQGIGWYRLHFKAPASDVGGSLQWLEFDAASRAAKVWLNDRYLGEHRGGFARFRFDATAAIHQGGENVLVVRVDNTQPAAGAATADILPLTGDFFVHGGLYRPVRLVTTAPLHIDMMDSGGSGIHATTVSADRDAASVLAQVRIANAMKKATKASVRVMLVDREGKEAGSVSVPTIIASNRVAEIKANISVAAPHLWNGTIDPYLYKLVVEVADGKGKIVDRVRQDFGIRTAAFDPDRGFILNGQPYLLRGVGYHQDRDGKGWAISRSDVEEDVATIREMGANSIRLTHYQHGQDIHEIADRTGIVLWDEIPLVSMWTLAGQLNADPALVANARQQLTELIRQNENHAATMVWSIANEVDLGNTLPFLLPKNGEGPLPDPMPLLKELSSLAKTLDPSRPTALATCCEDAMQRPGLTIPTTATAVDLGGANRYFGWYLGTPSDLGPHLDKLRASRPNQPLAVTEYGAGGALTIHTDNVLGGAPASGGYAQPEEYQSYIHETALPQIAARPWLYASWLWNSFDFATRVRAEGDSQDINTKGLVTYDHRTRKDAWYYYKANWNPAPMVHITSKRYNDRAYSLTDIKVYSNTNQTELLLNGRSLGAKSACPQMVCIWKSVGLHDGLNVLTARGSYAGGQVEDQTRWNFAAERRDNFAIDTGTLVAAKSNNRMLGSDTWFEGGSAASLDAPADFGRPAKPTAIAGTEERDALASYRHGTFSYRIPAPAGRYRVTLWFATHSGQMRGHFDVKSNGTTLLRQFEPTIPSSGAVAEAKSFALASNGFLKLDFLAGSADARVSLIEVQRAR